MVNTTTTTTNTYRSGAGPEAGAGAGPGAGAGAGPEAVAAASAGSGAQDKINKRLYLNKKAEKNKSNVRLELKKLLLCLHLYSTISSKNMYRIMLDFIFCGISIISNQ